MNEKIKRLRELQEQKSRKAHLESLRADLTKQQRELSEKTSFLKDAMVKEQKDVERLEKGGVVSLFHKLTGRSEEKLQKEQREARDAKGAYQAAVWELESVAQQLHRNEGLLAELEGCESKYETLLKELMTGVNDSELEVLNSRLAEVMEEMSRIKEALRQIETVRSDLQEAIRWVSTVHVENNEAARKRDKALLNARWGLNSLQEQAQLLQTEVKIYPTMISGVGSDTLTGNGILQMIKNTFGHLSQAETSLQEHLEQSDNLHRKLEKERDDILIAILCGN